MKYLSSVVMDVIKLFGVKINIKNSISNTKYYKPKTLIFVPLILFHSTPYFQLYGDHE